ncbi:hypothetical protein Rs2_04923 [Raphanus sativus]|nr:hypothetical protein Rs2_04923 [Raphanus sativus]
MDSGSSLVERRGLESNYVGSSGDAVGPERCDRGALDSCWVFSGSIKTQAPRDRASIRIVKRVISGIVSRSSTRETGGPEGSAVWCSRQRICLGSEPVLNASSMFGELPFSLFYPGGNCSMSDVLLLGFV